MNPYFGATSTGSNVGASEMLQRRFTIQDVRQQIMRRERAKYTVYEKVLDRVFQHIIVSINSDQEYCMYEIPSLIPGLPVFDMAKCSIFIINVLLNKGFDASFTPPNMINIEWHIQRPHVLSLDDIAEPASPTYRPSIAIAAAAPPTPTSYNPSVQSLPPIPSYESDNRPIVPRSSMTLALEDKPWGSDQPTISNIRPLTPGTSDTPSADERRSTRQAYEARRRENLMFDYIPKKRS